METILTFEKAIEIANSKGKAPHLLTGNGFSIACRPNIFQYGKLFEQADFTRLSPSAQLVFGVLGTTDFERVIRALRDAAKLVRLYSKDVDIQTRMESDADGLKELLVNTIAKSHPERPSDIQDEEYAACQKFLSNFDKIYTLNYDLLLYWTLMHTEEGTAPSSDDGFRKSKEDFDAGYVVWEPENTFDQNIHYLHGALHIFDAGSEIQKYTWINTGVRLIEQIRNALSREFYPLFVAEGTSKEKIQRIKHSDFLSKAYRSFQQIGGSIFIYGHSLAENDEHFLRVIEKGKIGKVFIGIFGDPDSDSAKAVIKRGKRLESNRKKGDLTVYFYDSASAKVWGN